MKRRITLAAAAALICAAVVVLDRFSLIPRRYYYGGRFGIETVSSGVDFDGDGIDDYADIVKGARADAKRRPKYTDKYYAGGYPPQNEGVCTDLVWRAFAEAGYCLRDMVDSDIAENPADYPSVKTRDKNIDFRRVPTLKSFFDKYALPLTTDVSDIAAFQPGDIVITNGTKHIGIVSDRRNKKGIPYLLHNAGQPVREEDCLERVKITAHYRVSFAALPERLAIKYEKN